MALASSQHPSFASSLALRQSRAPILGLLLHGSSRFVIPAASALPRGFVASRFGFDWKLWRGPKVQDPDMLEKIRLTIITNLLKYHPESSERLAMGDAFGIKAPSRKLDADIATLVHVKDDGLKSLLYIETADQPGLLMEIMKIITNTSIEVESEEINTEGLLAKYKLHVSYRGAALNIPLSEVLINCLRYHLQKPESREDSC